MDIIKNIDFRGVSGRINFPGRSSRLSDIDIIQWFKNGSQEFLTDVNVGVYKPNYTRYADIHDHIFTSYVFILSLGTIGSDVMLPIAYPTQLTL